MAYGQAVLNEENRFVPRVRFRDGRGVNLGAVQAAIQDKCDENGIPVAFRNDQLKTGSILNKQTENIVIMYHPNHVTDYLQFLLRITYQGTYAFLDVFKVGGSTNYYHDNTAAKSTGRKILNALSGHNAKLQEEEDYYTILSDCIEAILE